ncbi:MAG: pilus assembly protein [Alphaproteobacteria bacterium]|nr:pilus assembly protein [Alphaproteobacteria bacterium]
MLSALSLESARHRAKAFARRFAQAREGMNAVEFAMITPFMLALFFGANEFSNAMTIDRKVTAAANSVADLVAQAQTVDDSDIADVFDAAKAIIVPFPTSPIKVVVSSVVADGQGKTTVAWSDGYATPPRAKGSAITLPNGIVTAGGSVIMSEVTYSYESPIGVAITGPINLKDTFYLKPRRTLKVARK